MPFFSEYIESLQYGSTSSNIFKIGITDTYRGFKKPDFTRRLGDVCFNESLNSHHRKSNTDTNHVTVQLTKFSEFSSNKPASDNSFGNTNIDNGSMSIHQKQTNISEQNGQQVGHRSSEYIHNTSIIRENIFSNKKLPLTIINSNQDTANTSIPVLNVPFQDEPDWFEESVRRFTGNIKERFNMLTDSNKLESLKQSAYLFFLNDDGINIETNIHVELINLLEKNSKVGYYEFLKNISKTGNFKVYINALNDLDKAEVYRKFAVHRPTIYQSVFQYLTNRSFNEFVEWQPFIFPAHEKESLLKSFEKLASHRDASANLSHFLMMLEDLDSLHRFEAVEYLVAELSDREPNTFNNAVLQDLIRLTNKLDESERTLMLRNVFRFALENAKVSDIFDIASNDVEKAMIWSCAFANLENEFSINNALVLAGIINKLPFDRVSTACQEMARVALDNDSAEPIFEVLIAPMTDKLGAAEFFICFSKEAARRGELWLAGALLEKIPELSDRNQAWILTAASLGIYSNPQSQIVLASWANKFPNHARNRFKYYSENFPENSLSSKNSRDIKDFINRYAADNKVTYKNAALHLYNHAEFELDDKKIIYLNIVKKLPDSIDGPDLATKNSYLKLFNRTQALLSELNPELYESIQNSADRAEFREKLYIIYKNNEDRTLNKSFLAKDSILFKKIPSTLTEQKLYVNESIKFFEKMNLNDRKLGWRFLIADLLEEAVKTTDQAKIFDYLISRAIVEFDSSTKISAAVSVEGQTEASDRNIATVLHLINGSIFDPYDLLPLFYNALTLLSYKNIQLPLHQSSINLLLNAISSLSTGNLNMAVEVLCHNIISISTIEDDEVESYVLKLLNTGSDKAIAFSSVVNATNKVGVALSSRRLKVFNALKVFYKENLSNPNLIPLLVSVNSEDFPINAVSEDDLKPMITYLSSLMLDPSKKSLNDEQKNVIRHVIKWIDFLANTQATVDEKGSDAAKRLSILKSVFEVIKTNDTALKFAIAEISLADFHTFWREDYLNMRTGTRDLGTAKNYLGMFFENIEFFTERLKSLEVEVANLPFTQNDRTLPVPGIINGPSLFGIKESIHKIKRDLAIDFRSCILKLDNLPDSEKLDALGYMLNVWSDLGNIRRGTTISHESDLSLEYGVFGDPVENDFLKTVLPKLALTDRVNGVLVYMHYITESPNLNARHKTRMLDSLDFSRLLRLTTDTHAKLNQRRKIALDLVKADSNLTGLAITGITETAKREWNEQKAFFNDLISREKRVAILRVPKPRFVFVKNGKTLPVLKESYVRTIKTIDTRKTAVNRPNAFTYLYDFGGGLYDKQFNGGKMIIKYDRATKSAIICAHAGGAGNFVGLTPKQSLSVLRKNFKSETGLSLNSKNVKLNILAGCNTAAGKENSLAAIIQRGLGIKEVHAYLSTFDAQKPLSFNDRHSGLTAFVAKEDYLPDMPSRTKMVSHWAFRNTRGRAIDLSNSFRQWKYRMRHPVIKLTDAELGL